MFNYKLLRYKIPSHDTSSFSSYLADNGTMAKNAYNSSDSSKPLNVMGYLNGRSINVIRVAISSRAFSFQVDSSGGIFHNTSLTEQRSSAGNDRPSHK